MARESEVVCPKCGSVVKPVDTSFGPRRSCCGLHGWGGKPLVSPETHQARKAAHHAFDPLWQTGEMSRAEAYAALARVLKLEPADCHIGLMDEATALLVPNAVTLIQDRRRKPNRRRAK